MKNVCPLGAAAENKSVALVLRAQLVATALRDRLQHRLGRRAGEAACEVGRRWPAGGTQGCQSALDSRHDAGKRTTTNKQSCTDEAPEARRLAPISHAWCRPVREGPSLCVAGRHSERLGGIWGRGPLTDLGLVVTRELQVGLRRRGKGVDGATVRMPCWHC
jgi:hypothetical protein